jgi:hypothetical protein
MDDAPCVTRRTGIMSPAPQLLARRSTGVADADDIVRGLDFVADRMLFYLTRPAKASFLPEREVPAASTLPLTSHRCRASASLRETHAHAVRWALHSTVPCVPHARFSRSLARSMIVLVARRSARTEAGLAMPPQLRSIPPTLLRTPHKTAWEKGTVPGGFVRGSKKMCG